MIIFIIAMSIVIYVVQIIFCILNIMEFRSYKTYRVDGSFVENSTGTEFFMTKRDCLIMLIPGVFYLMLVYVFFRNVYENFDSMRWK